MGRNVARIAKGFGMEVSAFDEFVPADKIEAQGVRAAKSRDDLFETNDIVSLHIPATDETRQSINYDVVNKLPKNGILINTARKEVINEPELLKLLADRPDLKYITDIKPDADADFQKFEGRYFSTPKKMGAQTARQTSMPVSLPQSKSMLSSRMATPSSRSTSNMRKSM